MTKRKVLITGANSLLGKYLTNELVSNFDLYLSFHHQPTDTFFKKKHFNKALLDITYPKKVNNLITKINPDAIIHLASISNIDYCENHPKLGFEINVKGTQNICNAINNTKIHLIFASSNAVFDGTTPSYNEDAKPNPLNQYGKTKFECEKLIQNYKFPSTIVRLTTLFGWPPEGARDNDITYYVKQLNSEGQLNLVDDRFFNPISAWTAAEAINVILQKNITGVFHVAGLDRVNRYQFVQMISEAFKLKPKAQIIPVPSDFYPNLAPRPKDATLAIAKMQQELKIIPQPLISDLNLLSKNIPD